MPVIRSLSHYLTLFPFERIIKYHFWSREWKGEISFGVMPWLNVKPTCCVTHESKAAVGLQKKGAKVTDGVSDMWIKWNLGGSVVLAVSLVTLNIIAVTFFLNNAFGEFFLVITHVNCNGNCVLTIGSYSYNDFSEGRQKLLHANQR